MNSLNQSFDDPVVIVSHGSPSDPEPQEAFVRRLAEQVAAELPGRQILGATLAAEGALARALDEAEGARVLIYPLFMADGWFVSTALPRRTEAAAPGRTLVALPFGLDAEIPGLAVSAARAAAQEAGYPEHKTAILLAAHGSPSDPRAGRAADKCAAEMRAQSRFRTVTTGFVDQAPYLADAARLPSPAICVPFFAARAGHVMEDLPEALEAANFDGPCVPPLGAMPDAPGIIARALMREAEAGAA